MPTRNGNLTEEEENEAKMTALRAAIQAGLDSGVAEPGVFERVRARIDKLEEHQLTVLRAAIAEGDASPEA